MLTYQERFLTPEECIEFGIIQDIKIYTFNGDKYIEIPTTAKLWHQKTGKDVHTPHKVAPSVYKILIKKEFNYFSGLLQRVRD